MYYKIVVSGTDIFFENYASDIPVIGFIACRLIEADTEELAVATAKRDILVQWNQSFNADRKMGLPRLTVENIARFKGLFKPTIKHDYYWFTDDAHKQEHLERFTRRRSFPFWPRKTSREASSN